MPPKRKRTETEAPAVSIFFHLQRVKGGLLRLDGRRSWLEQRCARLFACDKSTAERMVDEYERFLAIKIHERDWYAKVCSPSDAIDAVWHAHILDTVLYMGDCLHACQNVLQHNPDGDVDEDLRTKRRAHTLVLYRELFGQEPGALWTGGEVEDKNEEDEGEKKEEEFSLIVFQVKQMSGANLTVGGRPSDTIRSVKRQIQVVWGVPEDQQMLIFGGRVLNDERSLSNCKIVDSATVHMVLSMRGC